MSSVSNSGPRNSTLASNPPKEVKATPEAAPAASAKAPDASAAPAAAPAADPAPARSAARPDVVRDTRGAVARGVEAARGALLERAATRPPAPALQDVKAGKAELRPGMEGEAVKELQRRVGVQPTGVYGPTTQAAVQAFQDRQGLAANPPGAVGATTWNALEGSAATPATAQARTGTLASGVPAAATGVGTPSTTANAGTVGNNGFANVDLNTFFKGGSNSPSAIIVGTSEGNRTPTGGFKDSYQGHTDPGNNAANIGSFSYQAHQGGASTPQQADALWNKKLEGQMPAYQQAARAAGLDPNNALLASNFADLYTQSPEAATGKGGFLDQLKTVGQNGGATPENILKARMESYKDPSTGRLDAPGFGNDPQRLLADQQRRMGALDSALSAQGLKGTPSASNPLDVGGALNGLVTSASNTLSGAANTVSGLASSAANTLSGLVPGLGGRTNTAPSATPSSVAVPQLTPKDVPTPALDRAVAGGRVLKAGDEGTEVKELQKLLGFGDGGQTGKLGPTTEAAIKAFQKDHNIVQNGMVGPQTLAALRQATKEPSVDTNNPTLKALANGDLQGDRVGLCVTATLNNMDRLGIPQPAATGNDEGNNPRGGMVQMMKDFNWKSVPLPGSTPTTINSAYGTVKANVVPAAEYEKLAREGKIPSGAVVFQTRHPTWNMTSDGSSGFDMGIARDGGRTLFNFADMGRPLVYGADTQSVVVLAPGNALR